MTVQPLNLAKCVLKSTLSSRWVHAADIRGTVGAAALLTLASYVPTYLNAALREDTPGGKVCPRYGDPHRAVADSVIGSWAHYWTRIRRCWLSMLALALAWLIARPSSLLGLRWRCVHVSAHEEATNTKWCRIDFWVGITTRVALSKVLRRGERRERCFGRKKQLPSTGCLNPEWRALSTCGGCQREGKVQLEIAKIP